jgi:two-component system response regulator AtoC
MSEAAPQQRTILVVDGEAGQRQALTVLIKQGGHEPTAVASTEAALAELGRRRFDVVLAEAAAAEPIAHQLVEQGVDTGLVVVGAVSSESAPIHAFVPRPPRKEELLAALRSAHELVALRRENHALRVALAGRAQHAVPEDSSLVGASPPMQAVLRTVHKIAEHKTTVLITGESGTGKELVARAIHAASPRREAPFVAVNCGAIPEALLESELFGHKKGAFTDAVRDKRGLFSEASGGTLFLDEIGEMPLAPQVKLLRVLQEQQVRPLGSTEDERVDVRVVAATMRDLAADVREGRFREDLFYRLNVIQLALPPLRERREDLPQLVEHFLRRTNQKLGTRVLHVAPDAMALLVAHFWPGNVRELENTIERSVVLCDGDTLTRAGLPDRLHSDRDPVREVLSSGELSIKKTVRIIEEELIRRALRATGGNRTNASKRLEISHRALLYKMKEYGVVEPVGGAARAGHVEKLDNEG